jgi:glycosyltransferase 2 family protein
VTDDLRQPRTLEQFDTAGIARLLLRRGLPLLVILIVSASIALVVVSKIGDVSDHVDHVDAPLLVASALVYAALQIALMEIWRRLLRRLHGSFGAEAEREAWQVSQLGKYVPTGAMLFVTRVLMAGRAGGNRPVALASTVYELFASFLAAVAVAAAAIGSMHQLDHSAFRWAVYVAPLPLLLALHPRILVPVANKALARTGREPLPAELSFGRVLAYVVVYSITFIVAGLGILALTEAITHVPSSDVWLVVASFSVAYVASVLGFLLPAGIGVRESGMALALSAAIPLSVAIAVAVMSRLVQVCVELMLAGIAALVARRGRRVAA